MIPFAYNRQEHVRCCWVRRLVDPIEHDEKNWLEYGTDYAVTNIQKQDTGGTLTILAELPENAEKLLIRRVTPKTQDVDLHNGGRLTAELIEGMGDKITMGLQEIDEQMLEKDGFGTAIGWENVAIKVSGIEAALKNLSSSKAPINATLGDELESHSLPSTDSSPITSLLQIVRNNLKFIFKELEDLPGWRQGLEKWLEEWMQERIPAAKLEAWPIGSIYMSVDDTSPADLFGGTWTVWGSGLVPVGIDKSQTEFNKTEKKGGAKTHTLTKAQMPAHAHDIKVLPCLTCSAEPNAIAGTKYPGSSSSAPLWSNTDGIFNSIVETGNGAAHNNLQPYITCYMWKRTV